MGGISRSFLPLFSNARREGALGMTESQWIEYLKRSKTWSIRMGFDLLHSKAYQELNYGPALKTLNWFYEEVQFRVNRRRRGKDRYEIMNEGKMSFTYNEAKVRGLDHRKFSRALKELVACGFIDIEKHGFRVDG